MPHDERKRHLQQESSIGRRAAESERKFSAPRTPRESRALFQSLVDSIEELAIYLLDPDGCVIIWNVGAERLWGYRGEEILGRHVSHLYTTEDIAAEKPCYDLDRAFTEGRTNGEAWRTRGDDSHFLASSTITALRDESGRLQGFSCVVQDNTDRTKAERALHESEQRLGLVMDNSPAVIFIKEPGGRLLFVNETWKRTFRSAAGEWVGRTESEAWPPEVARRLLDQEAAVLASDVPVESLDSLPTEHGETLWWFFKFAFTDPSGRRLIGGTGIDVTERERAREEIRQLNAELEKRVLERTAQLTAANEELDAFSYSVSHDLRAPLRGIDGFSQALLEDCADKLDPVELDYLHRVRAEAQRMGELIDDLLELSRVSRADLRRQRVGLTTLAKQIAANLRQRDRSRQVEFAIADGMNAHADPRLLRIVLENLLENAWKFTSRRPQARIECGETISASGSKVWCVRDNGVGFDMAYAGQLFGAFQRLHSDTEFPGAGIGLATVQRIIHRHGGHIWAESEIDHGAAFCFTLGAE